VLVTRIWPVLLFLFSVFSAVSGLKLSMVNEQHQCRSIHFLLTFRLLLLDDDVVPAGSALIAAWIETILLCLWKLDSSVVSCWFADVLLPVTCVILVGLFSLQHFGTHRVGFLFAPIVCLWFLCISTIGVYNIIVWNPHIYKALSPYYMYSFIQKTQVGGWMSLGGILLCVTGKQRR